MLKFTKDHEWLRLDGEVATVGITDHAQEQLGDLVFVDLPTVGATFEQGAAAAVVESVKAASDIYCPVDGEVTEVNEAVAQEPGTINSDPMAAGWLFKLKIADKTQLDGLLDEAGYKAILS